MPYPRRLTLRQRVDALSTQVTELAALVNARTRPVEPSGPTLATGASGTAANDIWSRALAVIATKVNRYSFHTWFANTRLVDDADSGIAVEVSDEMVIDWLTSHYSMEIADVMAAVGRPGVHVTFVAAPRPWARRSKSARPDMPAVPEHLGFLAGEIAVPKDFDRIDVPFHPNRRKLDRLRAKRPPRARGRRR